MTRGPLLDPRALMLGALLTMAGCAEDVGIDPPEPLFQQPTVQYPLSQWDADVESDVLVRVLVNEMGEVDSVEVLESGVHPDFDQAAINGVKELKFRPARRGDRRVTVWAQVPVRFAKKPRAGGHP